MQYLASLGERMMMGKLRDWPTTAYEELFNDLKSVETIATDIKWIPG